MGVVDKFKEFVAPIDDEGDDILEVEEEVEETPRSRYERPKTKNVNTANTMKAKTKMVLFEPRSFSESDEVAKRLKEGNAVVVNLHKLDREYAQRTIDFLTGVVFALDGKIQKVGTNVIPQSERLRCRECLNLHTGGTVGDGGAKNLLGGTVGLHSQFNALQERQII